MITLPYSLIIEATDDPDFFGFYSPDLEGFTGIGHSIEDCVYKARSGMADHVEVIRQQGLPVPPSNPNPTPALLSKSRREIVSEAGKWDMVTKFSIRTRRSSSSRRRLA